MSQKPGPLQAPPGEPAALKRELRDPVSPALGNCRLPPGADVAVSGVKRDAG